MPTVIVALLVAACGSSPPATERSPEPTGVAATPVGSSPTLAASRPPPDLSTRSLAWFAPLPPMPGRTGSVDFMDLFEPEAAWPAAAGHIDVFKLYGEWVAYHASSEDLRTAVTEIARRGFALAVEVGPLDPPAGCGVGVESFAGREEGLRIADRIAAAGGRLDLIALDEPYYYGHVYAGANACRLEIPEVADDVAAYVLALRSRFPALAVGDIEPSPVPVTPAGLGEWVETYRAAAGEPFAFIHLDVDWSRREWPTFMSETARIVRDRGVPFGIIYNGGAAPAPEAWVALAGERAKTLEGLAGQPDHVVFQSWMVQPDHVLPESDDASFTGLVRRYFEDFDSLGFATSGAGANLALGRSASASAAIADGSAANVADGDFDTAWNAGAGPPAWVEVQLDGPSRIAAIRLTVGQFPAGRTEHLVLGRTAGGALVELWTFEGSTADGDLLAATPEAPWDAVTAVRIETVTSPSWVAWRELEVVAAE
jgi:hypothetical protein